MALFWLKKHVVEGDCFCLPLGECMKPAILHLLDQTYSYSCPWTETVGSVRGNKLHMLGR
jgi:hypothetical protein